MQDGEQILGVHGLREHGALLCNTDTGAPCGSGPLRNTGFRTERPGAGRSFG